MKALLALSTLALTITLSAHAQAPKVDFYTTSDLASMEHTFRGKIDPATGTAGHILEHYPNHLTMFIFRDRDGQSELHQSFADVFIAVDGHAELWTGGQMQNAKTTEPGEQRGSGLTGTTHVSLSKGTIVHIPAGVPHQLRIGKGDTFTYFVVKANETK